MTPYGLVRKCCCGAWRARSRIRNGKNETQDDDRALAYLYWTPTDRIAASLELIGEDFSAHKRDNPFPQDVRTLTTPLRLTYAAPTGWFATARTAFVAQDVDRPDDVAK